MIYVIVVLVALVAFLGGALAITVGAYRFAVASELQGRPVLVTLPGNRPNTRVTYAVRPSGWKRLTAKAHLQARHGITEMARAGVRRAVRVGDKP